MSISKKIERSHILRAIIHIDKFGSPIKNQGRNYFLKVGTIQYPVIYTICVANIYAEGFFLVHDASDFNSLQAINHLENLGFEIIERKSL
jgi:hypothetical protein